MQWFKQSAQALNSDNPAIKSFDFYLAPYIMLMNTKLLAKFMTEKKKNLIKLSLGTFMAVFPAEAYSQSLNCPSPLIFGQIITCGSAGSVTVRTDNTSTSSCVTVSGPISRARCIVTQSFPFRPIQFSIDATSFTITNGTSNMSVDNFRMLAGSAPCCTTTQTVPVLDVPIGATLNVGAAQADGLYTGSFGVTAILQ